MSSTSLLALLGILLLTGAVAGLRAAGRTAGAADELAVGMPAPDFTLQGSDGRTYTLSQFKGKQAVVVAWFPKAFTGGWTRECKSLRESGDAIRAFDVAYFAASVDDLADNTKFAAHVEADYPILADPTKAVARAYGVLSPLRVAHRWTFYVGVDGKILHIDKKISTGSAGEDIASTLARLGVKKR